MSAICGLFRFDGAPVPRSEIVALLDALRGFGPDAASWLSEPGGRAALGCVPFRVTPEDDHYHPPIRSPDGRVVLVADARIDNRAELAQRLGIGAADAAGMPDAAFIEAAYRAWGAGCVPNLLGDFAFLLWDDRSGSLLAARDGLGQRVLFVHRNARRIAFATSAQALLALDDVPARLNEQKVAESLVLLQDPGSTFFAGIDRVPPGHLLTVTADGVRAEQYWSPEPTRRIVLGSDREYVEGFREVFDAACQAQIRCRGPIGIMLSGGLDSSSVAATAAPPLAAQGRRLLAFHAAPRKGFVGVPRRSWVADESADVEALAAGHPNIDLSIHRTDGRTPLDSIDAVFARAGLPVRNPSNWTWAEAIYAAAQAAGVRVLLAGHRGNAGISYDGLRSLPDLARRGRWAYVWREVRALARARNKQPRAVLWDQVLRPLVPRSVLLGTRWLRRLPASPIWERSDSAINPEFAVAAGMEERARAFGRDELSLRRLGGLASRVISLKGLADIPDLESAVRPWFGIESRDPTGDRRVVEYCLAIPDAQYLHDGNSRWLIRRAMENRVPDQVRERRTWGSQGADWTEWLPAMRESLVEELDLSARSDTVRRMLDVPRMRALVDQMPSRLMPAHEPAYKLTLLRGIAMARYIRWFERTYG